MPKRLYVVLIFVGTTLFPADAVNVQQSQDEIATAIALSKVP
jgi:hypothetical protein